MSDNVLLPPTLSANAAPVRVGSHSDDDTATPDTMFGLSFDSVSRAQQFMLAVKGLADDHRLDLVDAVLVVKDDDHNVRVHETIDPQASRSALSGAMWTGCWG